MKIYKATLILYYTDNSCYKTRFDFELENKEYEFNEKHKHWCSRGEGWLTEIIPGTMTVERGVSCALKVIQGFDYELDKQELDKLEKDMRNLMKRQLDYEKKEYLKQYEVKLRTLLKE